VQSSRPDPAPCFIWILGSHFLKTDMFVHVGGSTDNLEKNMYQDQAYSFFLFWTMLLHKIPKQHYIMYVNKWSHSSNPVKLINGTRPSSGMYFFQEYILHQD
jgi:hypothetical protein